MRVYAVDPGPEKSGFALLQWESNAARGDLPNIRRALKVANAELLSYLWHLDEDSNGVLVIEQIVGMGMICGSEVFETAFWSGRFVEAWSSRWDRMTRREVKINLCGHSTAKDANVRQALIDRWGGPETVQRAKKGTKKNPGREAGVLGAITADMWSALAVGMTWWDSRPRERRISTDADV